MARLRGFRQVQGYRRKTAWSVGPGGTGNTPFSSSNGAILASVVNPTVNESTIVRIRGHFAAYLLTADAGGSGFQGAFGIGLATKSATTAGAASVPLPLDDQDWDGWLYHRYFGIHEGELQSGPSSAIQFEVDSKAMRKFPDPEWSCYAATQVVEIGTATMDSFFDSRMLLKLA